MSKKDTTTPFGKLKSDSSDIGQIRTYFDLFKNNATAIADEQYNDLNLEDFFNYSNRCVTPVGEMLLYSRVRHISKSNTEGREEIIALIGSNNNFREKVEDALSGLIDRGGFSTPSLLSLSINLSKWHRYLKFLPIIYIAIIGILWVFASQTVLLVSCLFILLCNTLIHYWNKSYVETDIRPLVQLHKVRSAAIKLIQIDQYNQSGQINESIDEISKLGKKVSVFTLNRWMESEFAIVITAAIEVIKAFFLIEPIVINTLSTKIGDINRHTRNLIDYLGEWDVLYSISSFRVWLKQNNLTWSMPSFTDVNGYFNAKEMYHPLIADCVPNSIIIDKSVIITGSNMSGKSSFIKTIGVNIVAAYAMNMCFAKSMVLPNCRLHTVLSVSDDINSAQSYYYSEAQRIKLIIDQCNNSPLDSTNIVLIDEIFKGTNTIERISIANAVIQYFAKLNNTLVIVSTHDIELARSFEELLNTYHFSEQMEQAKLQFNYKLIAGVEYTRNAISILRNCDYPEEIIACAELNTQKICKSMDSISL